MQRCHLTYCINSMDGVWTVSCGHVPSGRFETRSAALRSAVQDAERVSRMGHQITVLVGRPLGSPALPRRVLHAPAHHRD